MKSEVTYQYDTDSNLNGIIRCIPNIIKYKKPGMFEDIEAYYKNIEDGYNSIGKYINKQQIFINNIYIYIYFLKLFN